MIDGTIGEGGHAKEIIKHIEPNGIFLGIDWDKNQTKKAKQNISGVSTKVVIAEGNYRDIPDIQKRYGLPMADGLLLDLGFSSAHLRSGRGFSFQKDEPLDMRYNEKSGGETAREALQNLKEGEIADILSTYGEEKRAREIARRIVEARKKKRLETTMDLVRLIGEKRTGKIHPATRTFQALRMYVNKELENLEEVLKSLPLVLTHGGRAAIITFHSLEDRMVKQAFRVYEDKGIGKRIHKKVIKPSREEVLQNPRSRSAKLRGFLLTNN